jgi:hypothetical protein
MRVFLALFLTYRALMPRLSRGSVGAEMGPSEKGVSDR